MLFSGRFDYTIGGDGVVVSRFERNFSRFSIDVNLSLYGKSISGFFHGKMGAVKFGEILVLGDKLQVSCERKRLSLSRRVKWIVSSTAPTIELWSFLDWRKWREGGAICVTDGGESVLSFEIASHNSILTAISEPGEIILGGSQQGLACREVLIWSLIGVVGYCIPDFFSNG